MEQYMYTWKLLKESIMSNDIIILLAAIVALVMMIFTIAFKKSLSICCKDEKRVNIVSLNRLIALTNLTYNLFMTMITIFPLLGMLGTVFGLLGLDLASGDMDNIKNNFFIALTSTAWGIIFSVFFKLCHAVIVTGVEEAIDSSKKIIEEMNK